MKKRLPSLLVCFCLFALSGAAQSRKPPLVIANRAALFTKLIADLSLDEANELFRRYRPDLKLVRVSRNRHEPGLQDSLLRVSTAADQLQFSKNRYKAMLLGGKFSSTKVSFAGMRVGVAQDVFCRTLRLQPGHDTYVVRDGEENFLQLTFRFSGGKLKQVEYDMLVPLESID